MADWEGDSDEVSVPIAFPVKKKWANEDVDEDQIKDSWDIASSEDEEDKANPPKEETPKKKKATIAQKIAEKEQKRKQAAEERERRKQNYSEEEDSELDFLEKKKRDAKAVIEADLENAEGMFKGVTIRETEGSPLDRIDPKTKEEFDEFSNLLVERIRKHEKQGLYVNFINGFVRELCSSLKDVDIRKVSSTLATVANEKAKAVKEAHKTKKKKAKPSLQAGKDDILDTADYGNYDDDYDDFM
ncbi:translation initiation factor eIF3 subunit [Gigaspora margarita]|uniref:Eukaryotic translation initiation factor 3 subunit J n=1 Tax=Gigaspora margarita TaxID=4874 RepID=A0A8H4A0Q4_GIGMA|nr:translation initiation factor eIF3 subunit [Gigaspora margarita]